MQNFQNLHFDHTKNVCYIFGVPLGKRVVIEATYQRLKDKMAQLTGKPFEKVVPSKDVKAIESSFKANVNKRLGDGFAATTAELTAANLI